MNLDNLSDIELYERGEQCFQQKDYDAMITYYDAAILKGNRGAINAMNDMGYYNDIILNNTDLALHYYTEAAALGSISAMYNLGMYYFNKDYDLSKKYHLLAANGGDKDSSCELFRLYHRKRSDISFLLHRKCFDQYSFDKLINNSFAQNVLKLPIDAECLNIFRNLDFSGHDVDNIVCIKQYILQKTAIFPSNYDVNYFPHFMEVMCCGWNNHLKDITPIIAGYIFT